MSTIRMALTAALLIGGAACYPAYGQGTTMPQPQAEPQQFNGPPGGAADPYGQPQQGYQAQGFQQPGYGGATYGDPNAPTAYADPNALGPAPDPNNVQADAQPVDPNDPSAQQQMDPNAMGPVNDDQINQTLDGYGQWQDDPDYGQVWVPDATVVGEDFTPYETAGGWVDTDYGWAYNSSWNWGWLPFHYGRWGWFHGRWGWVRGHEWGPAWVDWRYGGGYVGWRPMMPANYRGRAFDSHWRFSSVGDLGRPNIHGHLFRNPSEGLRVTSGVGRLPVRGAGRPVRAASLMGPHRGYTAQPSWGNRQSFQRSPQAFHQTAPAFRQPAYRQPAYNTQYRGPQQTYRAPAQSYRAPAQSYRPAPSYRSYSGPSRSYSAPSRSYSAPSHSSSSSSSHSSSSSSSHSSSSSSHSSGGGGHHH